MMCFSCSHALKHLRLVAYASKFETLINVQLSTHWTFWIFMFSS